MADAIRKLTVGENHMVWCDSDQTREIHMPLIDDQYKRGLNTL
jgi:hypothetical protein